VTYGAAIAVVAAGLIWLQPSEFGIKVALLAGITVVCAFVPLLNRIFAGARPLQWASLRRVAAPVAVAAVITLATPAAVMILASDRLVVAIDGRGSPPSAVGAGPIPSDIPQQ
jgi:hypothetical protein